MNITTWEQYKKEAYKTFNPELKENKKAALEYIENKVIEELAEILGAYTKHKFHGKEPNYLEELGDLFWYLANYENCGGIVCKLESPFALYHNDIGKAIKDMLEEFLCSHVDYKYNYILSNIYGIVSSLNLTDSQVWTENIKKLRKRHGESYNPEHYRAV